MSQRHACLTSQRPRSLTSQRPSSLTSRAPWSLTCQRLDFVKTKHNSTQLNSKQLAFELDTVVTWNPSPHNKFSVTSRAAGELKFDTYTH